MAAATMTMLVTAAAVALASPAPQQPLLARFAADPVVGYAPGYAYGGGVAVVPAGPTSLPAVHVAKAAALYADQPAAAVAYAPSFVYKPDLSAYAAASFPQVEQLRRFDPGFRPVHTIVPKVTAVEPSVTVQKTYVDVPVVQLHHPSAYYGYQLIDRK